MANTYSTTEHQSTAHHAIPKHSFLRGKNIFDKNSFQKLCLCADRRPSFFLALTSQSTDTTLDGVHPQLAIHFVVRKHFQQTRLTPPQFKVIPQLGSRRRCPAHVPSFQFNPARSHFSSNEFCPRFVILQHSSVQHEESFFPVLAVQHFVFVVPGKFAQ